MHDKENRSEDSGITIIDIVFIFLKHKKAIIYSTLVFLVISVIVYFFILDLIFLSTASIKSSSKGSGLMGVLDGGLPDIGGLDDLGMGGSKSAKELASYEEILNSRRCLEGLILKFGLMERDEYLFIEDAVKDFRENKLVIKQEKLAGILYVGVLDKDPVLAKEMVDYLIQELDKINIEINIQNAKSNKEFIENRYNQSRIDLYKAEDSLKAYQQIYGIAPDLQIKASAQSLFTLEAELKAEEVKLEVLKKILNSDQPEVKTQHAKVNALKSKITELQTSTDLNDFLRLGNSPQIALTYLRLVREVEIQTKIMVFMLPIYEQAKIEEKRETPTIIILDKPVVSERKTKPKRLTMVLVFTFFGFIISSSFFILKSKYNIYKEAYLKIDDDKVK